MLNQTTNRYTVARKDLVKTFDKPTATATAQTKAESTKEETTARLTALMDKRNELLTALEQFPNLEELTTARAETINTLCETIAQISVYKTLLKLSDSPKDITTSGAEKCAEMYRQFSIDMAIYRHKDTTQNYSDAFDLFNLAYIQVWEYLHTTAPLTLDDTVLTITNKSGAEKNYTIFQTACKSIREYIHSWSKTDNFKKLHYIVGIADNGEIVTSSKRPLDKLEDISQSTKAEFFNRYGLTAREQDIMSLYIKGDGAETIATLLNLNLRMVQRDIKTAKAKFKTASAYAEYITAQNAEKLARAKAEKNPTDSLYQRIWKQAENRTAQALQEWKKAFKEENRQR